MSKETSTWMPFYVSDYLKDTMHLSTQEHGAYLLLIMHAWTRDGALPSDEARLTRIAGLTPKEWKASRDVILEFFTLADGAYRHARIDRELGKAEAMVEQRRAAGVASAAARKAQRNGNDRSTSVATEPQRNGRPSPSHIAAKAACAGGDEIVGVVGEIARAAGVPTVDAGRIAEQQTIVKAWIEAGADPDMILETVKRCAVSAKQKPKSLRYFDGAVRDAIAAKTERSSEALSFADQIIAREQRRLAS